MNVNYWEYFGQLNFLKIICTEKIFTVITDHRALLSFIKKNSSNKSYNSRLTRWIDRLLPFQFDIEHLPRAKIGLVDYISRRPFQKPNKISTFDAEFFVATLKLISASINSLELKKTKPAPHLHQLLKAYNPALQIPPKIEANNKAINLISTHAARVHKHDYYNSPFPRKLVSNTNYNINNLKYADPASQISLHTSLAKRNTNNRKQLFQNWNELTLAPRGTQIIHSKFPPIGRHSLNISKSHHPQIKSVLFASHHLKNQSCISNSTQPLSSNSSSDTNYISKINNNISSKKCITRVRFNDASRTANQQSSSENTTCPASQRSNSPGNTRTARQQSNLPDNTHIA